MLLLGPTEWKRARWRETPMGLRRQVQEAVQPRPCVLMEDVETEPGEDLDWQTKFNRILDSHRFGAIVVVWPHRAKMQATWDELLLLRERRRSRPLPEI